MSKAKVLTIGLDMGDGQLIRHWSNLGRLPHFSKLIERGCWLDLETPTRILHTSGWPTFATGTSPGTHGVYYPYQPRPGRQIASHIEPDQYGAPTLWRIASEQGSRCIVYDIPETFPETGSDGVGIYDWGTWAWHGTPASQPAGILLDLKKKFGPYPLGLEAKRLGLRIPGSKDLEERLIRSIRYKFQTFEWLLEKEPWDLAIAGICETHPAGHYLWPGGLDSPTEGEPGHFEPLLRVYQTLDTELGALINRRDDKTVLLLLSTDGVRANRVGCHLLGPMLERLGYTAGPGGDGKSQSPGARRSLLGRARRLMPPGTKRWIADSLPWWLRDRLGSQATASEIDWPRTKAFALPTDLEGCIRVNLKGREPEGIVNPGSEYHDVCQAISKDLKALVNPASGQPAVKEVWTRNEVFPGARQEHLPDLIVTWNDDSPIDSLVSPRVGEVAGVNPDRRPGTHSPLGFLIAVGAGIPAGSNQSGRLVEVAPTILKLLGLHSGKEMEGRPTLFENLPTIGAAVE